MPVVELVGDSAHYTPLPCGRRGCIYIEEETIWRIIARHVGNCVKLTAITDTNATFDVVTSKGNITPRGLKLLIDYTKHDKDLQAVVAAIRGPK